MKPFLSRLISALLLTAASGLLAQTPAPDLVPGPKAPGPPAAAPLDPKLPTIFVAGDSTAARGRGEAQQGWGVPFADYFDLTKVNVANRARGGRSSRTFIAEGSWDQLLAEVKPGDIVLIQFGVNDGGAINEEPPGSKQPLRARGSLPGLGEESQEIDNAVTKKHEVVHTYGWYMRKYIADTKAKGASPVVLGLNIRNIWQDGRIERYQGKYNAWAYAVARAAGVPYVDLTNFMADELEKMGEEKVKAIYQQDHTHYNAVGADLHAAGVVAGLKGLRLKPLAGLLSAKGNEVAPDGMAWLQLPRPANPKLPSLFLIGDSTVRNGHGDGAGNQLGWGEPVVAYFDPEKINVVNRAVGGTSSRSYYTSPHWAAVLAMLKPGDFVIMQFGTNDNGEVSDGARGRASLKGVGPETREIENQATKQHEVVFTFGGYLRKFIAEARAKGATPIVCSLVPRKIWKDGKIHRDTESYAGWAAQVASGEGAAFVDLNELIARRYDELGPEQVNPLFGDEHTHTSAPGAELSAACVIAGLKAVPDNPLAPYFSAKAAGVAAAAPPAFAADWPNPLIRQRADPQVLRHADGYYYFMATVPEYDRLELRRAPTIAGLATAEPKVIWNKHATGAMGSHVWAPEIHFIGGKWYVYFAAGGAERVWDIRIYVLENTSANPLEGVWAEKGQLKTNWESFALDATTFEHRGTRYLVWAQKDPQIRGNSNLYLAKMDTPWSITGKQVRISQPEFPWEQKLYSVNEGPAVLQRNGRIFVSYSASGTDFNYCLGLLTADENADLLDPRSWAKSPQPVFTTSEENHVYGPGHNSFTTSADGRTDLLVYHARSYRDIKGDPLHDPNRDTRVQPLGWKADGAPDFGVPRADTAASAAKATEGGTAAAPVTAAKPLFRDPVFDGAADPVVIWNPHVKKWWMFYTNRRANAPGLSGVAWVHGTRIGIAESAEGAAWTYVGTADIELPADVGGTEPTHWAPDVITAPDGTHHMFLSVVPGIFNDWQHPRTIVHLTSADLRTWRHAASLRLASDRVIDACVDRLPDGTWRMWYNNERDHKSIYYAESPDLAAWTDRGKAAGVGERPGEGPYVFQWKGHYWMLVDLWKGLGVYRSDDLLHWAPQPENLLGVPGHGADDGVIGGHPGVVVNGGRAFCFYFTHPGRTGAIDPKDKDALELRRSSIQVVELVEHDGQLTCDRDAPVQISLQPPAI